MEGVEIKKVLPMQSVHYAQHHGEACPYCRSVAVTAAGQPLGATRRRWTSPMRCTECGARWKDVHILIGYLPDGTGIDYE